MIDENASLERDIEFVLITGAGASNAMGDPPFPLMDDWRKSLQSHLQKEVPAFADLVNLNEDIDGQEFERRLGVFLREALDYTSSEDLVLRSFELPFVANTMNGQALSDWRLQFSNALGRLTQEIYQSTFNEFGRNNLFSMKLAEESYSDLLGAIGIWPDESTWVLATTNYDHIAEMTLHRLDFHPFSGEERGLSSGGQFRLNAKGLAGFASPHRTPVLHLHGSVGWFHEINGKAYGLDSVTTYDSSLGLPILLLPDLNKDYGSIPLMIDMWEEFHTVLRRAQSVLVLGHSLNDAELRFALRDDVVDGRRIAIAQRTPNSEGELRSADEEKLALDLGLQHSPSIIPINFGHGIHEATVKALNDWQSRKESI